MLKQIKPTYQESFHGDTHDQECLTAEDDVLHWIQKIWEDDYVELDADENANICEEEIEERNDAGAE